MNSRLLARSLLGRRQSLEVNRQSLKCTLERGLRIFEETDYFCILYTIALKQQSKCSDLYNLSKI
ncbi:hypothetical protein [Phormidium nigroviride]